MIWPITLPSRPLLTGYEETLGDGTLRTQTDVGPAKVRQRYTAVSDRLTVQYNLSSVEVVDLVDFYKISTAGGALAFDYQHPRTGATVQVRFLSPPSIVPSGNRYRVTVRLEVLP